MMEDPVEEELAIMNERATSPGVIQADVLQEPIREICRGAAVSVESTATVRAAIRTMQERGFGSVLIEVDGRLAGIVTERDILMKVGGDSETLEKPVTEIMTPDPETLRADDTLQFLMNKMHVGGFRHVPIVDENDAPLHVVSLRDVLRYLLDHFGPSVVNIPSEPFRGEPKRYSG